MNISIELRHAYYVVAVAEELSFRKAAERLHIAQPALSIQIKTIEEKLGGKLFHRTSRRVQITKAGRLFVEEGRRLIQQAEKSFDVVQKAMKGQLGSIELACTGSAVFSGIVGTAVRNFKKNSPEVEIHLREINPRHQLAELEAGNIDAGFVTAPALATPTGVIAEELASWPMMVAVSAKGRFAQKESIKPEMLEHQPFIVYTQSADDDISKIIQSITGFTPALTHHADNVMMVLGLVGAGLGIALMPSVLHPYANHLGVMLKPMAGKAITMDCSLMYRKGDREPLLQSFIDCAQHLEPEI